jgi:tetratricopeptide (TPR) repeat protein
MPTPSASDHRTAVAALDAARPLVARLDVAAHPEESAADLIESWSAVETALRAMLGGSSLAGQPLVSEVRQRGLLEYGHAHALLGFLAARDRAVRPDYVPTGDDLVTARSAFQALEQALGVGVAADTGMFTTVRPATDLRGTVQSARDVTPQRVGNGQGSAPLPPPPIPGGVAARGGGMPPAGGMSAAGTDGYARAPRRGPATGLVVGGSLAALALVGGLAWWATQRGGTPASYERGVAAYRAGQREVARREFAEAVRERPTLATPHVYLARLAREDGDLQRAATELSTAISLDTAAALPYREMGQLQLQAGRADVATRFLERAIRRDNADRVAQGWMGCALTRQGRPDLAQRWYERAGQGDWTACQPGAPLGPGGAPGAAPGGVPNGLPAGAPPPQGAPGGAYAPGAAPLPSGAAPRP